MIRLVSSSIEGRSDSLSSSPYVIEPCSEACILRECPPDGQVVSHGGFRNSVALISEDRLWLSIASGRHNVGHPLQLGPTSPFSTSDRRALLDLVLKTAPRYCAPIQSVCACSFSMPILSGRVLIDDDTRPNWHRRLFWAVRDDAASTFSWTQLACSLADLAEGLANLHTLGIAHNDPFAYNAVGYSDRDSVWIDFNSLLPASPETMAVDVFGFVAYTMVPSLVRSGYWAPDTLQRVCEGFRTDASSTLLSSLADRLRQADTIEPADGSVDYPGPEQCVIALGDRSDLMGAVARSNSAHGLTVYFREYGLLRRASLNGRRLLEAERVRHQIVEREIHRTAEVRRELEVASLRSWIDELEQGKAWLEDQRINLKAQAEALDQTLTAAQAHIAHLEGLERSNAEVLATLKRVVGANNAQLNDGSSQSGLLQVLESELVGARAVRNELAAIHGSYAWRMMRLVWRLRIWLAPVGSRRARVLGAVVRGLGLKRAGSSTARTKVTDTTESSDKEEPGMLEYRETMLRQRAAIRTARSDQTSGVIDPGIQE